jgi:hypothetical protein
MKGFGEIKKTTGDSELFPSSRRYATLSRRDDQDNLFKRCFELKRRKSVRIILLFWKYFLQGFLINYSG